MIVECIEYSQRFAKEFKKLPPIIQAKAIKTEALFRANPLHPGLRLHQLKGKLEGLWSISAGMDYRIIFKRMPKGDIVFISIGRHAIYDSLR